MSEWLAPNRIADKHQASNPGLPLSTVHALKVNSWFGDTELVIGKIMCLPSTQWGQESSIPTLPFPLKALGYRWNSRHQTWKEIWGGGTQWTLQGHFLVWSIIHIIPIWTHTLLLWLAMRRATNRFPRMFPLIYGSAETESWLGWAMKTFRHFSIAQGACYTVYISYAMYRSPTWFLCSCGRTLSTQPASHLNCVSASFHFFLSQNTI